MPDSRSPYQNHFFPKSWTACSVCCCASARSLTINFNSLIVEVAGLDRNEPAAGRWPSVRTECHCQHRGGLSNAGTIAPPSNQRFLPEDHIGDGQRPQHQPLKISEPPKPEGLGFWLRRRPPIRLRAAEGQHDLHQRGFGRLPPYWTLECLWPRSRLGRVPSRRPDMSRSGHTSARLRSGSRMHDTILGVPCQVLHTV